VVSFPDGTADPRGNAIDLGFSDGGGIIHDIVDAGDYIFLLARVSSDADFFVHRGSPTGGNWSQVGAAIEETPMDMWTDGGTVYLLVNRIDVAGLGCRLLPASAGPMEPWQECGGFPDYAKVGNNPFAVRGGLFGHGGSLVAWFEVQGLGEDTLAVHSATGGAWTEIGTVALPLPSAGDFDGETLFLGFRGQEAPAPVFGARPGGTFEALSAEGLPPGADPAMDGILGICALDGITYLLHGAYNSTPGALYELAVFRSL